MERRVVQVEHDGQLVPVHVHQFTPDATPTDQAPVVIASGGVDTWKEDLHKIWSAIASFTNMTVLAFDIAGTGESTVPMSPAGGAQIIEGLVAEARAIGDGRVAHVGISMGGYFTARAALSGLVDAAVILGGPVRAAFAKPADANSNMGGIIGNALGLAAPPSREELAARWQEFSLTTLIETTAATTPTLVVNGADDPLVPQEDSLLFEGRPNTTVVLVPDSGHCASNKLDEVVPQIIGWLTNNLVLEAHA
jgi:esterase FrsA